MSTFILANNDLVIFQVDQPSSNEKQMIDVTGNYENESEEISDDYTRGFEMTNNHNLWCLIFGKVEKISQ